MTPEEMDTQLQREPTAEQQIGEEMESRLKDMRAMQTALGGGDDPIATRKAIAHLGEHFGLLDDDGCVSIDDLNDAIYEYPLGVSSRTVFRIDLSTGGPGDWFEVECSQETRRAGAEASSWEQPYTVYSVERITYHYAPWFDHAERVLEGDDFDAVEAFARRVVPELVD